MKKKKALYILLPVTLVIWGGVIFRILSNPGDDDPLPVSGEMTETDQPSVVNPKDTFKLFLDYPDPFLGRRSQSKITEDTHRKSFSDIKAGIIKKPQKWPKIKYYGLVKNAKTNLRKVNLSIGQKMYLLNNKDRVDNLRLEKIYKDSVIVSLRHEYKTIHRK